MKYFLWTLKNIIKISFWIFLLTVSIHTFGLVLGILWFTIVSVSWNVILTLFRYRRLAGQEGAVIIFKTLFSEKFYLPFIVYGCYCSPKYGVNWVTDGFLPIDGLDEACKRHDAAMFEADYQLARAVITRKEHARKKNKGDWTFLKEAITSKNYVNGVYLAGLIIGFIGRLIVRSIKLLWL